MSTAWPLVPNVPCGVESTHFIDFLINYPKVPNVPCGVESFKRRREALSLQAALSQLCRMQTVEGGKGLNS